MAEKLKPASVRGELNAAGLRFAIAVSQFNSFITERLLAGALDGLAQCGADEKQIEIVRVPGSFELPITAKKLAATGRFDSIICIGCILRGETPHYDVVVSETARGIQLAQLDTGVPLIFCVLTCDTLEQAIDRAGLKSGNKGYEAGLGAVEMGSLVRKIAKNSAAGPLRLRPTGRGAVRMTLRHKSREFALQMLFEWDMTRRKPASVEQHFWKQARAADSTRKFANQLFEGAVAETEASDKLVEKLAENWRLERLAVVDRSILRLAIYELRFGTAPAKVAIDEALELAKKFSSAESPAFLNGILDAAWKSIEA